MPNMPSRQLNDYPMLINGIKCYSITDRDHLDAVHKEALLAAQVQHELVRENALRALRCHRLEEDKKLLRKIQKQEEQRLKLEQERADIAATIVELQKKKIEIPIVPKEEQATSEVRHPPATVPAIVKPTATGDPGLNLTDLEKEIEKELEETTEEKAQEKREAENDALSDTVPSPPTAEQIAKFESIESTLQAVRSQPERNPVKTPAAAPPEPPRNLAVQPTAEPPQAARNTVVPAVTLAPVAKSVNTSHLVPGAQEYLEIHKRLKQLRGFMTETAKRHPELKKKMGEGRREIRKSVGQLTEGKAGTNKLPLNKIMDVLRDALSVTQSPLVDPSMVMLKKPNVSSEPVAVNNGDQLPSLFIYLLNQFAKSVVRQLIDEAASKTKAANPIGVIVANVFAKPEHLWRGASLIDIQIAKFRVACPVLFGVRGNEKSEEGRARLGWKKENGEWISEQAHMFRMIGLGAGFASISLRDFSKSKMENPYPPTNYWTSMAAIVSTPLAETSPTQYTVLKSMISTFEERFLGAYGHAALAALQVALIDFPAQQQGREPAANSLIVLAEKLHRDDGFPFTFPPGW